MDNLTTIEKLERLLALKEKGAITEAEYLNQKSQILNTSPLSQKPGIETKEVTTDVIKNETSSRSETIIAIVFILFAIVALINFISDKKTSESNISSTSTQSELINVSAIELYNEYHNNEVAADNKYKGKTLIVNGTIEAINKDFSGSIYILLEVGVMLQNVHCEFADAQSAASFVKGQQVTFKGECTGMIIGNPVLKNCTTY